MFKLQQDVPVPRIMRERARGSRRKYPFEQMEVGHFFFVPDKQMSQIRSYFSAIGQELGIKLLSRQTYMRQVKGKWEPCEAGDAGATLGIGVWRTE